MTPIGDAQKLVSRMKNPQRPDTRKIFWWSPVKEREGNLSTLPWCKNGKVISGWRKNRTLPKWSWKKRTPIDRRLSQPTSQPASQHVMATGKQNHNRLTTFKTFAIILRRLSADSKISTNSNHFKMKICYQCLAWSKHWTNLSYKSCVNLFILE